MTDLETAHRDALQENRRRANRAAYWANPELARAKRRASHHANKDETNAKRRANPKSFETVERDRQRAYKWRYNITLDQRDELLASQGGVCAICKKSEHGGHDWCTDHDHACCPKKSHSCGECIRGIICFPCNVMLGNAQDNPTVLRAAIAYLAWPPGTGALQDAARKQLA